MMSRTEKENRMKLTCYFTQDCIGKALANVQEARLQLVQASDHLYRIDHDDQEVARKMIATVVNDVRALDSQLRTELKKLGMTFE